MKLALLIRGAWVRLLHPIARSAPGSESFRVWLHKMRGVNITGRVFISYGVYIDDDFPERVTIHNNTFIGIRTTILAHFREIGVVEIGPDVSIGPHCVILPNVHIGQGAVVAAGSVVSKDVPPYTFVGGAPSALPLARVTCPLGITGTYDAFIKGLKPLGKKKSTEQPRNTPNRGEASPPQTERPGP